MNPFAVVAERAAPRSSRVDVPARFVEFAERWCGIEWEKYPAQRLVAGCVYDGEPVPDTELARLLFGPGVTGVLDETLRSTLVAACGRRSGKTYTLVSLRLLHLMLVCDLSMIRPGQRPVALVIAPNKKLRQEAVNYALGAARAHDAMSRMLILPKGTSEDSAPSEFAMRRPDGAIVTFEGGVATEGGYGGRGRALVALALDESAFFRDKSAVVNDEDILKAAKVAVLPGGQVIVASSTWAKRGVLWEEFSANYGHPIRGVAVRAPTTVMNPAEWIAKLVARERTKDPDAARYEYDAEFLDGGTALFFDAALIAACTDPSLDGGRMPKPGEMVRAGADAGFRSDSSALAVAHLAGAMILIGELLEMRPEPGKPLVPSEVVRTFRDRCHAHGASYLTADGHYREAIVEHLGTIGFADAPAAPHEAFVRCRTLMREGRVRFPPNERLLRQLREVEARPLPGGGMAIHMPRWRTGGHGDLAQALVLAVSSFGGEPIAAPAPSWGSPEWEAAEQEKRRRELEAKRDDRYTRAPWKRRAR